MRTSLVLCCLMLLADTALPAARKLRADPPPAGDAAQREAVHVVRSRFVDSWLVKERRRARYSRAAMPPREARVRLQAHSPTPDANGAEFYTFAVDIRTSGKGRGRWSRAVMTGCTYPARGEVYVKRGRTYRNAGAFLGKRGADAPDTACVAAAPATGSSSLASRQP